MVDRSRLFKINVSLSAQENKLLDALCQKTGWGKRHAFREALKVLASQHGVKNP